MNWLYRTLVFSAAVTLAVGCDDRSSGSTTRPDFGGGSDMRDLGGNDQGGNDQGGGDQGGGGDATPDGGGGGLTIQDIRDPSRTNHPAEGTTVVVSGRVTAIDRKARTTGDGVDPNSLGSFWIQHPAGGPYSGIVVFNPAYEDGQPVDISSLEVGQTVEVTGEYDEFTLGSAAAGTLSEIRVESMTVLDATVQPLSPETVTAADVATGGSQAEAYESVLVQVGPVTVTDASPGFGQVEVADSLLIDDELTDYPIAPPEGHVYDRLAGVLTWTFDAVQLLPRDANDFEGDVNVDELTIQDLQNPDSADHPDPDTLVTVQGIVSAIDLQPSSSGSSSSYNNFWIQDPAGGVWSGIYCFTFGGNAYDPSGLEIGYTVRVTGDYVEYSGDGSVPQSQIEVASVEVVSNTPAPPTPLTVAPAELATDGENREQYEGVLVRVENVTVTQTDMSFGQVEVADSLLLDDDIYRYNDGGPPALGTVYEHIDGVMVWAFDTATLQPRSASDMVEQSE